MDEEIFAKLTVDISKMTDEEIVAQMEGQGCFLKKKAEDCKTFREIEDYLFYNYDEAMRIYELESRLELATQLRINYTLVYEKDDKIAKKRFEDLWQIWLNERGKYV